MGRAVKILIVFICILTIAFSSACDQDEDSSDDSDSMNFDDDTVSPNDDANDDVNDDADDDVNDDADDDADDDASECGEHFFEDIMIPMRDEKSLAAFIRRPVDDACRMPTILLQTPYNKEKARGLWFEESETEPLFGSADYAFVVADWRGYNGSEDAEYDDSPSLGEDGYDLVEWIAAQSWSDGKVGLWGVSALCRQQYLTAVKKPPSLAAAVPIFCEMNQTYENYYPGGVLRTEYTTFVFGYFGASLVEDHPYRDSLWALIELANKARDITIPMLLVAGWYDLYNTGTFNTFESLVADSPREIRDTHRLLVGDWIHFAAGGESSGMGRPFTDQEYYYTDQEKQIQTDSLAFFDRHLRGLPSAADDWERVRYVYSGDRQSGSSDTWPPPGAVETKYYLSDTGALTDTAPAGGEVSYPYDPDDPSPTVGGQTLLPTLSHGPHDQAEVLERNDNAVFVTEALGQSVRVAGAIRVDIDAATTGADTDFAARLTDVDESGNHLLVGEGIQRLKLREDLGAVSDVSPGARYSLTIRLTNHLAYTFAQGHRIGLIISSSNYPRFDANMNTGADFYADDGTAVIVNNTIYMDGASALFLPVISSR